MIVLVLLKSGKVRLRHPIDRGNLMARGMGVPKACQEQAAADS